jgi:hypothetical protein
MATIVLKPPTKTFADWQALNLRKKKKGIYGAATNPQLGIILENAYFRFERFGFRGCYGAKTKLRGCDVINFTCDVINFTAGPLSSRLCGRIDLPPRPHLRPQSICAHLFFLACTYTNHCFFVERC